MSRFEKQERFHDGVVASVRERHPQSPVWLELDELRARKPRTNTAMEWFDWCEEWRRAWIRLMSSIDRNKH